MIYRRRLLLRNSHILKRTLEDVRDKLVNRFNDLYDFNNASLRRDMLLLFLSRDELESRISFEVKQLPKIQDPSMTETYSLILQLRKVQIKNPVIKNQDVIITSTSDIIRDRIREQFDILESNYIPKIDLSWNKYTITKDGLKIGMTFIAKDDDAAESFLEDIENADKYLNVKSGLRALSFLDEDEDLHSDSFIEDERKILDSIFNMNTDNSISGISLLQRVELEEIKSQNNETVPDFFDGNEELQA